MPENSLKLLNLDLARTAPVQTIVSRLFEVATVFSMQQSGTMKKRFFAAIP
jgi:hypothetical protein